MARPPVLLIAVASVPSSQEPRRDGAYGRTMSQRRTAVVTRLRRALRVERHALGPRQFVLGRRVHEWHLSLLGLAAAGAMAAAGVAGGLPLAALVGTSVWLAVKDRRDLRPATRDTAAWGLGVHRVPGAPPPVPLAERVPLLAAIATAAVGALNVASALTPELPARVHALLTLGAMTEVTVSHALALPVGVALMGAAWPLVRRRGRALTAAVAMLVIVGGLDVLKGLDVEEAAASWALAAGLWRARDAFAVGPAERSLRRALARSAAVLAVALGVASLAILVAGAALTPHTAAAAIPLLALRLLTFTAFGVHVGGAFEWLPLGSGVLGLGAAVTVAAALLAPARASRAADPSSRPRAAALIRRYGGDTLSAFKLRADLPRRFSADGRAVVAYRIEAGTLLLAGDPVGPPDAVAALLHDTRAFARRHGLAFGALGASDTFAAAAQPVGLRRMYLGDEAILATGEWPLAGGARKSLRKAVNRIERFGYRAELREVGSLDGATLAALEEISRRWRRGVAERGFSMAHDALADELLPDALVVLARDADGTPRGFLHFVPVFGRAAVSLACMRRDRDTPNGLTDFLVVRAAGLLAERGIEEFSLNFAAFGRWLRAPGSPLERGARRLLRIGDSVFQIERLHRFNAKFDPRWQPRHLLFERPAALPRVALAAMWAEGQLPKPRVPQLLARPGLRSGEQAAIA
jgi:lysyl-tRNA synthetase, class II